MALALSLITLLVAGMIVGVSMYIVENLKETSTMKSDNERRLNVALAGLEFGKQKIIDSVLAGVLPKRSGGDSVSSADIAADTEHFQTLVAYRGANALIFDEGDFDTGDSSVKVDVYVYDLVYNAGNDIAFTPGLPPRMWDALWRGGTLNEYLVANPEEGVGPVTGGDPLNKKLGYYLVRSTASTPDGISITVEQSVVVQR